MSMKKWPKLIAISPILLLLSCNLPQDPNKTLLKIRNSHVLKIGACSAIDQPELNLLIAIAKELNTKIVWSFNSQEELYHLLEKNKLDLVTCEIHSDSPWSNKLSFTLPYSQINHTKYVFAVPKGENAWLSYINKFIYKEKGHK